MRALFFFLGLLTAVARTGSARALQAHTPTGEFIALSLAGGKASSAIAARPHKENHADLVASIPGWSAATAAGTVGLTGTGQASDSDPRVGNDAGFGFRVQVNSTSVGDGGQGNQASHSVDHSSQTGKSEPSNGAQSASSNDAPSIGQNWSAVHTGDPQDHGNSRTSSLPLRNASLLGNGFGLRIASEDPPETQVGNTDTAIPSQNASDGSDGSSSAGPGSDGESDGDTSGSSGSSGGNISYDGNDVQFNGSDVSGNQLIVSSSSELSGTAVAPADVDVNASTIYPANSSQIAGGNGSGTNESVAGSLQSGITSGSNASIDKAFTAATTSRTANSAASDAFINATDVVRKAAGPTIVGEKEASTEPIDVNKSRQQAAVSVAAAEKRAAEKVAEAERAADKRLADEKADKDRKALEQAGKAAAAIAAEKALAEEAIKRAEDKVAAAEAAAEERIKAIEKKAEERVRKERLAKEQAGKAAAAMAHEKAEAEERARAAARKADEAEKAAEDRVKELERKTAAAATAEVAAQKVEAEKAVTVAAAAAAAAAKAEKKASAEAKQAAQFEEETALKTHVALPQSSSFPLPSSRGAAYASPSPIRMDGDALPAAASEPPAASTVPATLASAVPSAGPNVSLAPSTSSAPAVSVAPATSSIPAAGGTAPATPEETSRADAPSQQPAMKQDAPGSRQTPETMAPGQNPLYRLGPPPPAPSASQPAAAGANHGICAEPKHPKISNEAFVWLCNWQERQVAAGSKTFVRAQRSPAREPRRIPRMVMQTARSPGEELATNGNWIRTWMDTNPTYDYMLLDDMDCTDFVVKLCSASEVQAYHVVQTGAQRADLFRYFWLRELGGVYADTDTEIRLPLATALQPNASMVSGRAMDSDFLAYEPKHPLMDRVIKYTTEYVLLQAEWWRKNDTRKCMTSHECVIRVTGPVAYRNAIIGAALDSGCMNNHTGRPTPPYEPEICAHSDEEPLRHIQVCPADVEGEVPVGQLDVWECGIVRHNDCRNSRMLRDCGSNHYSAAPRWFPDASVAASIASTTVGAMEDLQLSKPTQCSQCRSVAAVSHEEPWLEVETCLMSCVSSKKKGQRLWG